MNIRYVPEAQRRVRIALVEDEQDTTFIGQSKIIDDLDRSRSLRCVEFKPLDHEDFAIGGPVGQGRTKGQLDHLLRCLLAVITRLRAVCDASTAPLRRTNRALAGSACALLAPRLGAAAPALCSCLRGVRSRTARRELCGHDLVHHMEIRLDSEDLVIEGCRAGFLACDGCDIYRSH